MSSLDLVDAVNSEWVGSNNNGMVGEFDEYLEPWIQNNGYPLIRVTRIRGSGVLLNVVSYFFANQNSDVFILHLQELSVNHLVQMISTFY